MLTSPSHTSVRLISLTAAVALLSACGATQEVKDSVEAQRAAPAAAAAAIAPGVPIAGEVSDPVVGAPLEAAPGTPAQTADVAVDAATPGKTKKQNGGAGKVTANEPAKAAVAAPTAVGCAAAAPAGGNGGATDVGVTDSTIKVGGTFFNGGFLDKYGQAAESSARAYFSFINDQGGICGRKIEYITCDTAGTADGTSGCLSKLADQDKVFMMGPTLDFNLDIVTKKLAEEKLPWVGSSGLYDAEFTSPWFFPTQIRGGSVGALITTHTVNVLNKKKIGVSFLRNGAGPSCTTAVEQTAKKLGGELVGTAGNNDIETSLDSQVAALKNAGSEAVLFCNDPVNTVKFIQAAQRVGWQPTFFGGFVAAADVPAAAGTYGKGMYGLTMFDYYEGQTPGLKKYRQITEFYFPQTFHHFYEQVTYVGAAAIVDALRMTGPNVTREGFLKSLKSMTSYDLGLGLKLNFADLAGETPSGIILKADQNNQWQIESKRFVPAGSPSRGVSSSSFVGVASIRDRDTSAVLPTSWRSSL
ncbi:MAG: ABC transporter substrate-binding protein [Sporichthyaceae bacterium]